MMTTTDTAIPGDSARGTDATGLHAVSGLPRLLLRAEGAAALAAGVGLYLHLGGGILWLLPLLLAVDVSMVGYLAGPRPGAIVYDAVHNWALGLAVLALAWFLASPAIALAGAILVAHTGMDRLAGYGLKYPTSFGDTHLGRMGKGAEARDAGSPRASGGHVEAGR